MDPKLLAEFWSEVDDCGYHLRNLSYHRTEDLSEFYRLMKRLNTLQDKLKAQNEPERR